MFCNPLFTEEQRSDQPQQLMPSAPPLVSTVTDLVNPPPWEAQVLQWLTEVVARQQQTQQVQSSQYQYDVALVAKIQTITNQLTSENAGMYQKSCA